MLIFDFYVIGNNLCNIRKNIGMTQADVAEKAGISDRTYADIERGCVNMRMETFLRICKALGSTPNDVLLDEKKVEIEEIMELLRSSRERERNIALKLLKVYLEGK